MFEKFHRGDIYSADLSPGIGSEQSGSRPVLTSKQCGKLFQSYDYYCSNHQCKQKKQKVPHALPLK